MPTPFLFEIPEDIDEAFTDAADNLLDPNGFGRQVTLVFNTANTTNSCPNCTFNMILGRSSSRYNTNNTNPAGPLNIPFTAGECPVCHGKGKIETNGVPVQYVVNMCVIPSPVGGSEDTFQVPANSINDPATRYYALGYMSDKDNIERCNHAIMRGDKVKRVGPITPIGLRTERYIETYWEKVA
jgi:hypothetical protein